MPKDMKPMPPAETEDEAAMMELVDAVDAEAGAATDDMAPDPEMPYSVGALKALDKVLSSIVKAVPDFQYKPGWTPDPSLIQSGTMASRLPPEVWRPLVAFSEAVDALNTDGKFDNYKFVATEIVNDGLLREAIGKIMAAMKDQALVKALVEGPAPSGEEEPSEEVDMTEAYSGM